MNRREFLAGASGCAASAALGLPGYANDREPRVNFLFITADDMNWDTPSCFGGMPGITPNIDNLARQGISFRHAHVTAAVCQPSRECLMTGRYPHRNGGEGFQPINADIPTLQEQLRAAGYINAIIGKNSHLLPEEKFCWDAAARPADAGAGRKPSAYYEFCKSFFERARREKKPFFIMANSHDPHRPFAGSEQRQDDEELPYPPPSRTYQPDEIRVPGFLPDLPAVRTELAQYYSSSRRCDDTVGAILKALGESGYEDDTLVMFLSDNGISEPFAKTNCYLNSTRTPWIVRWPGRVKPGSINESDFISGIDFMPTILDAAGLGQVGGTDGSSFLPLLTGGRQKMPDHVFTVFHETSARRRFEMRCTQNARYGYIFNGWADGANRFQNEAQGGMAFRAMEEAAKTMPEVASRLKLFLYRVPEELYDFSKDPDALNNLADYPEHQKTIAEMRKTLLGWMQRTDDHLLPTFQSYLNTGKLPDQAPNPSRGRRRNQAGDASDVRE